MQRKFLLFVAPLLFSCTAHLRYHQLINDIPTQYPNYNTEIRFLGDSLPSRPFFEVVDIQLVLKGSYTKDQLRQKMEIEAIKEGVDAIIKVECQQESFDKVTVGTLLLDAFADNEEITTIPTYTTYARGIGIMYLENLDFIKEKPEYEYFYKIDSMGGLPQPFLKIEYKLTGQEHQVYPATADAMDIYNKYFKFYSDFHLLHQRERWEYLMENNRLKKRFLVSKTSGIIKTVGLKYDDKGRIKRISILENRTSGEILEHITYGYDENSHLKSRLIELADGSKVFENRIYENEILKHREIYISLPGSNPVHLKSSILYYQRDFLRDYYITEYAEKQQGIANTH